VVATPDVEEFERWMLEEYPHMRDDGHAGPQPQAQPGRADQPQAGRSRFRSVNIPVGALAPAGSARRRLSQSEPPQPPARNPIDGRSSRHYMGHSALPWRALPMRKHKPKHVTDVQIGLVNFFSWHWQC
jgi:hypothetical protein